jgi:EAL domain-containing protein (putative c-di-GMP-specific phosphodiesterase class I)
MVSTAEMAGELRHALTRGEISAWFQPQVDLAADRVVAAEALCRWHHSEWGWIGPSEFIPLAEQDGTIDEIGRYMTAEAVSAMAEWDVDVSVNVSPAQLESSAFVSWLLQMLQRIGRGARQLTLEVTEQRRVHDVASVVARLDRLRELGVGIAVDDFGAGQASLTQLKRLHATELKIDRSLVNDESSAASRMIGDAVAYAHRIGAQVVAEGVETAEQLERVARLGCDRAQGYLLGRPMPREQMTSLLAVG